MLKLVNAETKATHTALNNENKQTVSTIVNGIYTQARQSLEKHGIKMPPSDPQVLTEKNQRLNAFEGKVTIAIPVHALVGSFYLLATAT